MAFKTSQNYQGFKRTNFNNKSDTQRRRSLEKHFNAIGKQLPKYLQKGKITDSKLNKAITSLDKGYQRRIEKEKSVQLQYMKTVAQYNKTVSRANKGFIKTSTKLESQYLQGKEIFIPNLRSQGFQGDKLTFRPIGEENFKQLEDMQNRINTIKAQRKKLLDIDKSDLYNTTGNIVSFMNLVDQMQLDDDSYDILKKFFNEMTDFEKELFVKMRLADLRERYTIEGVLIMEDEVDKSKLWNGVYYGIQKVIEANRGVRLGVTGNGNIKEI